MEIDKLTKVINKFSEERDWDQFHSVKNLAMALSVESSELLEIFQWLTEEQSNAISSDSKKMEKINDEVADIFIYLLRIISKTDINLEAVINKMKKNALKYPLELAKGNSKKYDEY